MGNKKPRVVFTYVEAGMGHIIPMTGMANAFKRKYAEKCEIVESYIFSESKHEAVRAMGKELSDHTKRTMSNWFYNKFEALSYAVPSSLTLKILDAHFGKAKDLFYEDLVDLSPDLLVASYYLPAHLTNKANKKGLINSLIATYTPDPYIYPAWDRRCDNYIVNNDEAERLALKKGFKKGQVKKVPFIFKKDITDMKLDKVQASESVGIDGTLPTVLFTSGAYGAKDTAELIKEILKANLKINLVIICGKSESMLAEMRELEKGKGENTNMYIVGFTDKMANYMCASDLVIGKSGMNTVLEAVYLDRAVIINAAANRLEENIGKFLVKEGIAVKARKPKKIVEIIKSCLSSPDGFKKLTKNREKYQDATGDERAADVLFELLKTRFPEL